MSVPIIDFKSESVLDEIRKAYTTVGFAVFTNTLASEDKKTMDNWFKTIKDFFDGKINAITKKNQESLKVFF